MPQGAITMSWSQVGTVVVALAAGTWAIGNFWLSDIKTDVRDLRTDFKTAMSQNTQVREALSGVNLQLAQKISETREIVAGNSAKLDAVQSDVRALQSDTREMRSILLKAPWGPK